MSGMQPFLFEGESVVRIVTMDGEPWFVAADLCRILGIKNAADALKRLEAAEKGIAISDTLGGRQELLTVSESGLYALIFRSRKPAAVRFRLWVTNEVLPAIRKTGSYSNGEAAAAAPPPPELREFPNWSLEEMRTKGQTVDRYQRLYGTLAAQWVAPILGFPVPPAEVVERGRQYILILDDMAGPAAAE